MKKSINTKAMTMAFIFLAAITGSQTAQASQPQASAPTQPIHLIVKFITEDHATVDTPSSMARELVSPTILFGTIGLMMYAASNTSNDQKLINQFKIINDAIQRLDDKNFDADLDALILKFEETTYIKFIAARYDESYFFYNNFKIAYKVFENTKSATHLIELKKASQDFFESKQQQSSKIIADKKFMTKVAAVFGSLSAVCGLGAIYHYFAQTPF